MFPVRETRRPFVVELGAPTDRRRNQPLSLASSLSFLTGTLAAYWYRNAIELFLAGLADRSNPILAARKVT